jgi:hypothetical protein
MYIGDGARMIRDAFNLAREKHQQLFLLMSLMLSGLKEDLAKARQEKSTEPCSNF